MVDKILICINTIIRACLSNVTKLPACKFHVILLHYLPQFNWWIFAYVDIIFFIKWSDVQPLQVCLMCWRPLLNSTSYADIKGKELVAWIIFLLF